PCDRLEVESRSDWWLRRQQNGEPEGFCPFCSQPRGLDEQRLDKNGHPPLGGIAAPYTKACPA
ncbi:MAG: hypothetical protein AB1609_09570, partial [Bacillota bacterium]